MKSKKFLPLLLLSATLTTGCDNIKAPKLPKTEVDKQTVNDAFENLTKENRVYKADGVVGSVISKKRVIDNEKVSIKRNKKEITSAEIKSNFQLTEKIDTENNINYYLNESTAKVKINSKNYSQKLEEKYSIEYFEYTDTKDDKVVLNYANKTNKIFNQTDEWDKTIFDALKYYPSMAKKVVKEMVYEFQDALPYDIEEENGETISYYNDGDVFAFKYTYHVDLKDDEEHDDRMNGTFDAKTIAILDFTDAKWSVNVYRENKLDVTVTERLLSYDLGDEFESDSLYELGKEEILKGDKVTFESKMIDTIEVTEKDPKIKLPKVDKYTKIEEELK